MNTDFEGRTFPHLHDQYPYKRILTLPELSKYIGMAESYIYKLTSKKVIPHYQPLGKMIYFDRFEIDEWILSNPVHTKRDIERSANKMLLERRRK